MVCCIFCDLHCLDALGTAALGRADLNGKVMWRRVSTQSRSQKARSNSDEIRRQEDSAVVYGNQIQAYRGRSKASDAELKDQGGGS